MRTVVITMDERQFDGEGENRPEPMVLPDFISGLDRNDCEVWNLQKSDADAYASYEQYLAALEPLCSGGGEKPELILFRSGSLADEITVRLAYQLQLPCMLHVAQIQPGKETDGADTLLLYTGVYSSNMKAEYRVSNLPVILSLEDGLWSERRAVELSGAIGRAKHLPIRDIEVDNRTRPDWLLDYTVSALPQEHGLQSADLVFAGGRGLSGRASFAKLEELADLTDGAVGATRTAALNGWTDINRMLGISGSAVSPSAAVVFGASGAAPFMNGVRAGELLVAVNKDEHAPIFRYADIGIVEDADALLDQLLVLLREQKQTR